ncbi:hypothetical protein BaRGS_00033240 [Batillaria attramentaria]|uniref:PPM-type phosphatase domain-containing protein n=1 Tax=Batillaria attramentaria TaxID=370345 RepID=A0ABD0JKS6_9CAEN
MTLPAVVSRFVRLYVLSPETIVFGVLLLIVYNSVNHVRPLRKLVQRARVSLQLRFRGQNYNASNDSTDFDDTSDVAADKDRASWELKRDNAAVFAIQGRRQHMEDRFNVVTDLEHTGASIYGIFDGHGGEFAADFVEKTMFKSIMIRLLRGAPGETQNISSILTEEVLEVDRQLLAIARSNMEISGTTALLALVKGTVLTVANVGDSRGVICDKHGKMIPLSFDHKPHQMKERKRIQQAGGFVSFNGVWRVAGVLATSRALGDLPLKDKRFVTAEPDILTFDLRDMEPQFMILATDGLWDCFSSEEAVDYIKERLSEPHFGAKSLVMQAYYRGSVDNITVMVVNFQKKRASHVRKWSQ